MQSGAFKRIQAFMTVRRGARFRARYRRRHKRNHPAVAMLIAACGVLLIALGLILLVLPGPGTLVAVAGCALLAGESYRVARALDTIDLCVYRRWRRWRYHAGTADR